MRINLFEQNKIRKIKIKLFFFYIRKNNLYKITKIKIKLGILDFRYNMFI